MSEPVYLDHAATSFPKAPGVSRAMMSFLDEDAGNPGRGGHRLTVAASRAVERARERVAELLCADPERTLFGAGSTFWLNALLSGLLEVGDRVVCSSLEHNAVMRPLRALEERRGLKIHTVEALDPQGVPEPAEILDAVSAAPTRLVVLTQASNVSGAVLPVAAIARAIAPVPLIIDAAQSAGSIPQDFDALGAAALVCSAHKGLLGPPGLGVLLLARDFELPPFIFGGTGSRSESELMPELLPDRLEAGTPNSVGIVGLGAACDYLMERGIASIQEHELRLARRAAQALAEIPGVELPGYRADRPSTGTFSLRLRGADLGSLALQLDRAHGILLRPGLHCAPAAHRRLGTFPEGTLRVSFGPFNTDRDVDRLLVAIAELAQAARSSPSQHQESNS